MIRKVVFLGRGSSIAFWMWIQNPCDFPKCRKLVCIICGIWGVVFKQIHISKKSIYILKEIQALENPTKINCKWWQMPVRQGRGTA